MASLFFFALRCLLLAATVCAGGSAWAAMSLDGATVNGFSAVSVASGESVTVQATTSLNFSTYWRATSWQIGSGPAVCVDHADYVKPGSGWQSFAETFSVMAPMTPGTYNLNLIASSSNSCSGGTSASRSLNGAITVVAPPVVNAINRAASSPNPALANASVSWDVSFSAPVTGVDASDFILMQSGGASAASITGVAGSGANWTVTANTGTSSSGTLGLNLVDDDSIKGDSAPFIALGGSGAGNGNFTGQTYTLTATPVPFLQKTVSSSSGRVGDAVIFTVTVSNPYDVPLTNVTVSDPLPAGMSLTANAATAGTVAVAGQNVAWSLANLPAQSSAQLTLVVALNAPGTLVNTASAPGAVSASASILVLVGAVTQFRMDEAVGTWNGTNGEVIDSGGTNLSGTRLATSSPTATNTVLPNPTIASQYSAVIGSFCNAGRFDGNAVVRVPSSPLLGYNTQFSASAWIYPTAYASELSSILSNDVNYEFHLNPSGKLYWWWNNGVSLTSATTIPLNQWTHVAIAFNSAAGNGRQRIYINGVLDTNSSAWTGNLQQNACPFYIGGDISTGSGCSLLPARNFRGMIDEVKLYGSELNVDQVRADMILGRSCSSTYFDHVRIEHDGVASVCAPKTVTIKACLDAACSMPYTGNVTVTLAPGGWVGGNTVTFSGGLTTRQLSVGTPGAVTLGGGGISPTPANSGVRCFIGNSETCTLNFSAASCNFDAVEPTAAPQTRLFTKLAGVPFNVDVLALQTATTVNAGYTGTVAVDLVDTSMSACPTGSGLNTAQNIAYVPANAGRKTVAFTYANAMRNVRVRARVVGSASAPACSTDSFAIRPQTFSSISSTNANADGSGASATATPTIKAGAAFALTADTNVVGYDGLPKIVPSLIEWPGAPTAGQIGALAGVFTAPASATTGNGATGAAFSYGEVGYFRFKTDGVYDDGFTAISGDQAGNDCIVGSTSNSAIAGKYGCNFGNAALSPYFGRFIPDHFDTGVTSACVAGSFTYAGQPFPLTVSAKNLSGVTTQNYAGAFARNVTLTARDAADTINNPGPGTLSPTNIANGVFIAGLANATPNYAFTAATTAPTAVRIRAGDGEATSLRSPAAASVEGQTTVRSGRARLSNAYGSERLDLPIVFRTEFWNGNGWVLNTDDTCTGNAALGAANAVNLAVAAAPANLTCIIDNGNPGLSGAGCAAAGPAAKRFREGAAVSVGFAGDFNLWLSAPGAGNTGSAQLTATVPLWLSPTPLRAMVAFGRYKSPLIYRREVY